MTNPEPCPERSDERSPEELNEKDLTYAIYTNASPTIHMTVTHLPTGLTVSGESQYQYRLKQDLIHELKEAIKAWNTRAK